MGALTDEVDVDRIAGNLRRAVAGGSSLPVEILKQFKDRFHVQILEGYGLSETSPVATFSQMGHEPRPGSIGIPVWGVEVKLIDPDWGTLDEVGLVGEVAIRGHNIMKGYYKRPDETAAAMRDGWFRSGDLARRDEDGFYYIVDRAKDMILRGGFNVYPREVEEVLMTHPDVSLAAVVGVPDERNGEEVKAFVILRDGAELTEDALVAWARDQMAGYKYPRTVEFRDALADDRDRQDPQARAELSWLPAATSRRRGRAVARTGRRAGYIADTRPSPFPPSPPSVAAAPPTGWHPISPLRAVERSRNPLQDAVIGIDVA